MIRQITYEEAGRAKLAEGIRRLCGVLVCDGGILVNGAYTRSASMAARYMEGEDLYVNQGIRLAAEAIAEINGETGCGTKEAACMLLVQLAACEQAVAAGINPVYLSRKIREAAHQVAAEVKNITVSDISSLKEELLEITGEEGLAEIVLQGMEAGQLVIKDSMQVDTRLKIIKGMTVGGTLLVGSAEVLTDVAVLVSNRKFTDFSDLRPLLEKIGSRPLFLVADDITGEALTMLKLNVEKKRIALWAVKAPGIGKRKADMLADLAILTRTRVYGEYDLLSEDDFSDDFLGKAEAIEVTAAYSIVKGSAGEAAAARIQQIQRQIEEPGTNFFDQQALRERVAGLSGQAPVIYVGGETTIEVREKKQRLEYAAAYVQSVKKYGMIPQGFADQIQASTTAEKIIVASIEKSLQEKDISAGLFLLLLQKITSMTAMWLTAGAVMVSTGYDREDRELMKQGVDVERLRR